MAERALLAITDLSVAVLVIDRLGCANGRPVEWRHTVIRGDRFSVTAEFPARTGYRLDIGATHHPSGVPTPRTSTKPTTATATAKEHTP